MQTRDTLNKTRIAVLGSTGSIGTQVLDVVRRFPQRFDVVALAAGKNGTLLKNQLAEFTPKAVCMREESDCGQLGFDGDKLGGDAGLVALATRSDVDTVIVGLVGMIGLAPTLAALKAGKKVLTANKETFVAGGHLVAPYLDQIIPIDSEHSAIFQCLKNEPRQAIEKIYLTASGGPFRKLPKAEFKNITRAQALNHPNWTMGPKITIDSATMMNKGLEVIEAHWLFGVDYDQVQVVVHPQSVVHSAVEFVDNSILAQMGAPDMHVPIQYAMFYPERVAADYAGSRLNLLGQSELNFEAPDLERFPCIELAYKAGRHGPGATTVLNAADEVAVELFLQDRIEFSAIPDILEGCVLAHLAGGKQENPCYETILEIDTWARRAAHEFAAKGRSGISMLRS